MATSQTSPEDKWELFHNYNRLVRRGVTKPLAHRCGTEFIFSIGDDDAPVLKCFQCGTTTYPGLNMLDDIRAVVKEHLL